MPSHAQVGQLSWRSTVSPFLPEALAFHFGLQVFAKPNGYSVPQQAALLVEIISVARFTTELDSVALVRELGR